MKITEIKTCIKFTFVLLFACVIGSCKQKAESTDNKSITKEENVEKSSVKSEASHFYITLKAQIKKDDQLQLFYIQEQSETYSPNQMLLKDVIGSDKYQDIVIDMPAGDYPLNFRLDLGTNKDQGSIHIEECVLHYGSKSFSINGDDMQKYFTLNDGVEIGSDARTFKLKMYKVMDEEKYDPFLVGNQKLNEVLIKNL